MVTFRTTLKKFDRQGEKTGWTYIEIDSAIAEQLKHGNKKSFRVKGMLDKHRIKGVALLPMGAGSFIMAINMDMRKAIGKRYGAMLDVQLQEDKQAFVFNKDFMECLGDEPEAKKFFTNLTGSHQKYFSKWIDSAKTEPTKAKRIAMAVTALSRKMGYNEMIRANKELKP
jgi:hypothetical protein